MYYLNNSEINLLLKRFLRISFLLFILFVSCFKSFAAPPNDDPCNATTLVAASTCNYQVFTTVGATASVGVPAPGCANYVGGDVWFKVVVPCTGNLLFDTNFGVLNDGGMAIYTGDCTNLVLKDCDDNSSPNGNMPSILETGLTTGTTLWIRMWAYGNASPGTFGICVSIPPPPPPGASCPTAGPFCTGSTYNFPNNTGVPGLGGGGIYTCLGSTPNPVFYYMQIENPGDLTIHITQDDASGNLIDVDYACWGPFPTLASICGNMTAANNISCSYSPSGDETAQINGAQTGEFYMLLLTNFSDDPGTIHFEQTGGAASTTCGIICTITASGPGSVCPGQSFNLSSDIPGGLPGATYSWVGPNCFQSSAEDPTGVIAPTAPGSYEYTVTATTPDGTSCNSTVVVTVGSITGGTASTTNASCPGSANGGITITPPATGGPFTYTLNPGAIIQVNNPVFTGVVAGTYSVDISNGGGCDQLISNIVVGAGSAVTGTAVPTATTCSGVSDGTITVTPPATGGPFVYTLNPGAIVQNNNPVFTGLAAGTYTITFTTAASCIGTVPAQTVNAGPSPSTTASPAATSCPSLNDGTITITAPASGGPFTYTLNPGLPTQVVQNNNPVFTGLATGTYTLQFTTAVGCVGTITSQTVIAGPTPSTTASAAATTCTELNDGTITITAPATGGPFTYTLNPGLPTEINQNNNPVFTGLATGTYTLQFTTAAGCVGTVPSQTVTAGPSPSTTAAPAPTTCPALNDGTITITAPASGGPFTYTLNPGLPTEVNQNNNPVFINLAVGTYTLQFTTAVGCIGTVPSQTINVGPTPSTTAAPTATTCPELNDGVITITAPATGGPFTYTLNPGLPTQIVQNNNPVFTNLPAGTYTLSFTTAAGCVGNVPSQTINVGPSPTATATPTATSCPTVNDGSITVVPPVTGGPFIYTLNPGLPTQVVQNNNPTFTNLAPGTYTISFTNAAGCNGTVSPNPVVAPGAVITDNPPTITNPPCANINDGVITIVPSVAGTYTYILNPGLPSQINNGNNPTFTNLAPGNYTYSFTSAIGCVGTGNTTLTTHSPLAISIILTQPLCNGNANGSITLSASGGVAPYQYALSPFTTYQGGTFNGLIAGTYTFRVKDDVGCTKDTTVTLGEPTLLTASSTSVAGTCNGNDGQITITANGGTPAYTYSIDNGVTFQSSNIFVVSGGNYPDIRVKDNNNCIANTGVNVVLIDNMGSIIPMRDTTICVGQSVTFQPQMGLGASVFHWSTIPDPSQSITLNDSTIQNAIATPIDTTTYTLHAMAGICFRDDTVTIRVLHKPIPYAGRDTAVCNDKTTAVLHGNATNLSGTINYEWSDTTNLETPHSISTVANPTSTETFTLTVTDNYGCNFSVTDEVTVVVKDPVPAFAGNDTIAVINQPHQLLGSGGVAYDWLPTYPLTIPTIANPMATLDHDQQFTLTVTDDIGCIGYDTVFVRVYPGPAYHVPNAFSPNGDGLNDIFRVIPAGITNTDWFRVFNRFGELVFETNQWLKGWDGTFKGKKQPVGNYVWMLKGMDKNGKVVEMKGTVMLIQ